MGEVWLAEQSAPVKRQVALKIIKACRYDKSASVRFDLERQALAMMDHPAIAKVFDAGSTAEGQPYFAMEYGESKHRHRPESLGMFRPKNATLGGDSLGVAS